MRIYIVEIFKRRFEQLKSDPDTPLDFSSREATETTMLNLFETYTNGGNLHDLAITWPSMLCGVAKAFDVITEV